MIKIIVGVSENGVIGNNNTIPWREPEDLKYFKRMTLGSTIIMGRKTFESLPGILPSRKHVIVSRTLEKAPANCKLYHDLGDALSNNPDCFVIGGAEIYKQTFDLADELYVTVVKGHYEGDTFFEMPKNFELAESEELGNLTFKLYKRIKS